MTKQEFITKATNYGVAATYAGKTGTMFVNGEDKKVKSFIRVCNLKGKGAYPFAIAQA